MKKSLIAFSFVLLAAIACDRDNNTEPRPEPQPAATTDTTPSNWEPPTEEPPGGMHCEVITEEVYQSDSVSINLSEIAAQTDGDYTFNFIKLIDKEAEKKEGNFFVSPISVKLAFAMLANGANGNTQQQIVDALGYKGKNIADLDGDCRTLISNWNALNSKYSESEYGCKQTIETANAIWSNKTFSMSESFIENTRQHFDAEAATLDFADKENALAIMNNWGKEKTHGLIPQMLNDLDSSFLMVLANSLYFKAKWTVGFFEPNTNEADFKNADGSVSKCQIMNNVEYYKYVRTEAFAMAELQYWGNTCIDVILPNEGISASECLSQLSQERFDAALSKLENKRLDLKLPKFDISYDIDLNDVMRTLGITDAFSEATADFSNMGTAVGINGDPYLSRAFQKSRISIDEDGTEAAAITVLTMEGTSAEFEPQPYVVPIEFYVNHQFIYVIREGNNILFVGKIEKM